MINKLIESIEDRILLQSEKEQTQDRKEFIYSLRSELEALNKIKMAISFGDIMNGENYVSRSFIELMSNPKIMAGLNRMAWEILKGKDDESTAVAIEDFIEIARNEL